MLALPFATFLAPTAWADEPRLSINGYDPVAYFTDGRPVQGKPEFEYSWHRLRWRFASGEHRDLFTRDPKHYAPQYDGYCALGTAADEAAHKDSVDPEAWAIVDSKLASTPRATVDRRRERCLIFRIKKCFALHESIEQGAALDRA